uniref:Uncharacterized protein n=1 Tax=Cannabis sativa TaxID=3483 RepID=A0A803P3S2_CANSA
MKKKKVTRNPTFRSRVEDPPSNQEFKIVDESAIDELDGIAILEIQSCSQMIEDEELIEKSNLRSIEKLVNGGLKSSIEAMLNTNLAKEVEKEDFQTSAQRHWAKLKEGQKISAAAKLRYEELMIKFCKRVA